MKHLFSMARTGRWIGLAGLLAWTGCGRPPASSLDSAQTAHSIPAGESAIREQLDACGADAERLDSSPAAITARQVAHLEPVPADPLLRDVDLDPVSPEVVPANSVISPAGESRRVASPFDLFDAKPTAGQVSYEAKSVVVGGTKTLSIESYFSGFSGTTKAATQDTHVVAPEKTSPADPYFAGEKSLRVEDHVVGTKSPTEDSKPKEDAKPKADQAAQPVMEQATLLPWARLVPEGPELEAVCDRTDQALRRGCALAERGATYSARAEFIQALRTLAEGLDARQESQWHAKSLLAGLLAMREVDDFQPAVGRAESSLSMEVLIGSHRTPVCQDIEVQKWTPAEATDRYHEFAQQQLAAAMGGESLGSLALYTLARIQLAMDGPAVEGNDALLAKAMTCHCAALLVDPKNFMAANELGVLLARRGDWNKAQAVLNQSLAATPQVVTWQNLAVVYEHLGNTPMEQIARKEASALAVEERKQGPGALSGRPNIRWIDPTAFAQTTSPSEFHDVTATAKTAAPLSADRSGSWAPWGTTRR